MPRIVGRLHVPLTASLIAAACIVGTGCSSDDGGGPADGVDTVSASDAASDTPSDAVRIERDSQAPDDDAGNDRDSRDGADTDGEGGGDAGDSDGALDAVDDTHDDAGDTEQAHDVTDVDALQDVVIDAIEDATLDTDVIDVSETPLSIVFIGDINSGTGYGVDFNIPARTILAYNLTTADGDRLVLQQRDLGLDRTGEGGIEVFNPSGSTLAAEEYSGSSLVRMPASAGTQLEIPTTAVYGIHFANYSEVAENYRLDVFCQGGPCEDGQVVIGSDTDTDGDLIPDVTDNCPAIPNASQADDDDDDIGDVCDQDDPWFPLTGASLELALRAEYTTNHRSLSYSSARTVMFSTIDNVGGQVECVYTGIKVFTSGIPDGAVMNTEHTWPQSRGASEEPARSDIHHLYPTEPASNSTRNNLFFGDVVADVTYDVAGSQRGDDADGVAVFEPRPVHVGNVARSMFYFAVMYAGDVPVGEEAALRLWMTSDEIDERERARNDAVEAAQGNRNPFVDHPNLVYRIANF
jgi:hypothetical protein